jgi:pantothenate kinase
LRYALLTRTVEAGGALAEGNYLLLDYYPWGELKELFDERWFVQVDVDEAMQRVEKRHIATGKPPEVEPPTLLNLRTLLDPY